jgi:1-deoxy-D-xylulose-5-phosphate reductoisomerase
MSAIVGAAGLAPGLKALQQGRTLALANKESLVTAGPLLLDAARASGATVLPVDSEHSAVFQALVGEDMAAVERVIITASGGAFRDWPAEKLAGARWPRRPRIRTGRWGSGSPSTARACSTRRWN